MHDQAEIAAQTGRAGVGAHRGEVAVVLGCVLQRAEATHREPGDRTPVVLGVRSEVRLDPREQLGDVEGLPVPCGPTNEVTGLEYQPACPPSGITTMIGLPAVRLRMPQKVGTGGSRRRRRGTCRGRDRCCPLLSVAVGKQDVDAGVPADRGGLEPVVLHARVVLVAVHDRQPEPVAAPGEYDQRLSGTLMTLGSAMPLTVAISGYSEASP